MGKAPAPPDPKETASASTSTNVGTAISNAMMGNVSQITPDGSLTYDQTGSYKWSDPYTGRSYDIPTFTATQTLSPEQQAIKQQTDAARGNLAGLANDQSAFLAEYMGQGLDTSGLPGLAPSAGQSGAVEGYNPNFSGDIGGNYRTSVGDGYTSDVNLATGYAGADDFSADRQRYEDALWQRGAADRAAQEETLRAQLLNRGLSEGGAAYNAEMERLARQNTDARLATQLAAGDEQARMVGLARDAAIFGNESALAQAGFGNQARLNQMGAENQASLGAAQFGQNAQQLGNMAGLAGADFSNRANLTNAQFQNAARAQGLQEAYAARSQPINEVIGLMSGSQVQQPNFVNPNMPTIPTTDTAGLINNHYNQQLQQWQQNQGILGGIMGGVGQLIGLSDERAKKDKRKVGHLDSVDLDVHEYRYKGEPESAPKRLGLMAQEVERKNPSAVIKRKGIRYVDYGRALSGKGSA